MFFFERRTVVASEEDVEGLLYEPFLELHFSDEIPRITSDFFERKLF